MIATRPTTIYLTGGKWQQVEWYVGTIILTRSYSVDRGVKIDWRWFSVGIPPYWGGSFTNQGSVTLTPSIYTSLEFYPSQDTRVDIFPG